MPQPTPQGAVPPFAIAGFPCSGMDWLARLLALHPHIAIVDAADPLGPLGNGTCTVGRAAPPPPDLAARVQRAIAAKPAARRVGLVELAGTSSGVEQDRIVVVRDGRDVLVHWTLRQLRATGPVLQRFLAKPEPERRLPAAEERLPELARRFAADPDDVLVHNRGLLLADYEWVRYGAHLWSEALDAHYGALGWANDHPSDEPEPRTVTFDEARAAVRTTFDSLCRWLGLDPTLVPPFAVPDPVASAESDPLRCAEWESNVWPRWFTKRASKLFKMDGSHGLDELAGYTFDDEWEGECAPA
jgi:hypothetical protein